jgi:hypothetical protein
VIIKGLYMANLVEIKILGTAITAQYGTLATGDILRCDQAFANHLVNDCKVAEFIKVDAPEKIEKKDDVKTKKTILC